MIHTIQTNHHKNLFRFATLSLSTLLILSGCGNVATTPTPLTVVGVIKPTGTEIPTTLPPTALPTAIPTTPTEAMPEPTIAPTTVAPTLTNDATATPVPAPIQPVANPVGSSGLPADFKLVFSDDFDGPQLDAGKWTTCYHWAEKLNGILSCATKNELQLFQPDNVTLENGIVRLQVKKEPSPRHAYERDHEYTSGMITTFDKFTFKYGYTEVRARMPKGRGFLSAFWTMPTDKTWPPEIDVIEVLGQDPAMAHLTLHFPKNGEKWKDDKDGGKFRGSDLTSEFNVFAAKWDETGVIWYVNGVERHRTDKSPNEPMYLLATLALGGNWAGPPDDQTPFPSYMDIDYIRVYQK